MNKIYKVIVVLTIAFMMLSSTVLLSFGQSDEKKCQDIEFRGYAYTPFRVHMAHPPAISQSITDTHNDPQSRLIFDQDEREKSEQPTTLSFYTNSTDNWRIMIDLEYNIEATRDNPRETIFTFSSNNVEYLKSPFFDTGFTSCYNLIINAIPPPENLTDEQILAVADKMSKENIQQLSNSNKELVDTVKTASERNDFMAVIFSAIFLAIITGGFLQRRSGRKLKIEMTIEKNAIQHERAMIKLDRSHSKVEKKNEYDAYKKSFDNIADQIMLLSRHLDLQIKRAVFREPVITIEQIEKQAKKEQLKEKAKIVEDVKPNTPQEEKDNEEDYEKRLLGDTQEHISKKEKITDIPDKVSIGLKSLTHLKQRIKPTKPESLRDKAYFKDLYRKDWGGDITKLTEIYLRLQQEHKDKPTDLKLLEMYAVHELAQETERGKN